MTERPPSPSSMVVPSHGVAPPSEPQLPTKRALPNGPIDKIAAAVSAVMSEVGVVSKEGTNKFHNYRYATIGDVLHKLTPLLGRHGLMITQSEVGKEFDKGRIAVQYEFTVAHSSGQIWPERLRKTGMAIAVDSKGNWDDKAINKSATAARKYFLLELFQIPTGDMEEADSDGTSSPPPQRHPPSPRPPRPVAKPTAPPEQSDRWAVVVNKGAGATAWMKSYIVKLDDCKDMTDIAEIEAANQKTLDYLYNSNSDLHRSIVEATRRRMDIISGVKVDGDGVIIEDTGAPKRDLMPDPKGNPEEVIAWVRTRMEGFKHMDEALAFWENNILPVADSFLDSDWQVMEALFNEAEKRLEP